MRVTLIFAVFLVLLLTVSANPMFQRVKRGGPQVPSGDKCDSLRCNRACQNQNYRGGKCSLGRCICM